MALSIAIAGCSSKKSDTPTVLTIPVKIGVIAPLTGAEAAYGEAVKSVLDMAVEGINAQVAKSGGKIELVYEDGKCEEKSALAAAQKLVAKDAVKFIIGGICNIETIAAASFTEVNHVILVSPGSRSPRIGLAGDHVFRTIPSNEGGAKKLAGYVIDKKYTKVGIISEQDNDTVGARVAFEEHLRTANINAIAQNYASTEKDVKGHLLKLKNNKIEALLINPATAEKGDVILKQLKEINFKPQLLLAGALGHSNKVLGSQKEFVEGAITADMVTSDSFAKFAGEYQIKYGKSIDQETVGAAAYDALMILRDAIAKNGIDPDKVMAHLLTLKDYKGMTGTFGFDPNGEPTTVLGLYMIQEGKRVALGANNASPKVAP